MQHSVNDWCTKPCPLPTMTLNDINIYSFSRRFYPQWLTNEKTSQYRRTKREQQIGLIVTISIACTFKLMVMRVLNQQSLNIWRILFCQHHLISTTWNKLTTQTEKSNNGCLSLLTTVSHVNRKHQDMFDSRAAISVLTHTEMQQQRRMLGNSVLREENRMRKNDW